VKELIEIGIYN